MECVTIIITNHVPYISLPLDQNLYLSGGRIAIPVMEQVRGPHKTDVSELPFNGGGLSLIMSGEPRMAL